MSTIQEQVATAQRAMLLDSLTTARRNREITSRTAEVAMLAAVAASERVNFLEELPEMKHLI